MDFNYNLRQLLSLFFALCVQFRNINNERHLFVIVFIIITTVLLSFTDHSHFFVLLLWRWCVEIIFQAVKSQVNLYLAISIRISTSIIIITKQFNAFNTIIYIFFIFLIL
jgi:hypothetical protein